MNVIALKRIPLPSNKVLVLGLGAVVLLSALVIAVGSFRSMSAQTVHTSQSTPGIADLNPENNVTAMPASTAPMREVHIANNGLVLLRGARVVSTSGSTFTVSMGWGEVDMQWKIQTDQSTTYFKQTGEKSAITAIHRGDFVTVTGMFDVSASQETINADVVRN